MQRLIVALRGSAVRGVRAARGEVLTALGLSSSLLIVHASRYRWRRTTSPRRGMLGAISTGRPNISSTSAATSCSATRARANMTKSSVRFDGS
jgi:hypothetical protein